MTPSTIKYNIINNPESTRFHFRYYEPLRGTHFGEHVTEGAKVVTKRWNFLCHLDSKKQESKDTAVYEEIIPIRKFIITNSRSNMVALHLRQVYDQPQGSKMVTLILHITCASPKKTRCHCTDACKAFFFTRRMPN